MAANNSVTLRGAFGAICLILGGFVMLLAARFGGSTLMFGIAAALLALGGLLLALRRR